MEDPILIYIKAMNHLKLNTKSYYLNALRSMNNYLRNDFSKDKILKYFNSEPFLALKPTSQNLYKRVLKGFLVYRSQEVEYIKETREIKKRINRESLPTKGEINTILKELGSEMDRCIFILFCESGCRISELTHAKIKHLYNKTTHYTIYIPESKSAQRSIPLIYSAPYITAWLNVHPDYRPEQYLFVHLYRDRVMGFHNNTLRKKINRCGDLIGKRLHPHLLRHTSVTNDLRRGLPPKQTCIKHGFSMKMLERYEHLVSEDLEKTELQLHGIETGKEEDIINLVENIECPRCKLKNPGSNRFCSRCGSVLDSLYLEKLESDQEEVKELYGSDRDALIADILDHLEARLKKARGSPPENIDPESR